MGAAVSAADWLRKLRSALQCGRSGCSCSRSAGNVHCPAHDDQVPSLGVTAKAGQLLVHCYAGCDQQTVLQALAERGLWPARGEAVATAPAVAATYDYRDERGQLLYQVVRYSPKAFRQRRPDGYGGWIWSLDGVRRVLYRLPELLSSATGRVYLVEGEKDADRLWSLGLPATTAPGGAGKWRSEYGEALRGRQVIVLPDNDEPGRKHALQVAASLATIAKEVRVLELPGLPPHGDVSDWLDAGGTAEQLEQLAAACPVWTQAKADPRTEALRRWLAACRLSLCPCGAQVLVWPDGLLSDWPQRSLHRHDGAQRRRPYVVEDADGLPG